MVMEEELKQILEEQTDSVVESQDVGKPAPIETDSAVEPQDVSESASIEADSAADAPVAVDPAAAPASEPLKRAWYVVHCYSGYENKVRKQLEQQMAARADIRELVFRIIVPTEEEIDVRQGQRKIVQRRVFPGYILVEMIPYVADDPPSKEAWYFVRNTPGVTGFVSSGNKPVPLREEEVAKILKRMESDQPKVRVTYRIGQAVHIIDGPFADFRGTVDDVNMEKGKVRVMVSFFGRETPVELDLLQVEKV